MKEMPNLSASNNWHYAFASQFLTVNVNQASRFSVLNHICFSVTAKLRQLIGKAGNLFSQ
jgi:hypothetical protein